MIAIPTVELAGQAMECGNCSGAEIDRFAKFGLTPVPASIVEVSLVAECFANLECRVADGSTVERYGLFVLEVVRGWIDPAVKNTRTIHHRGRGRFRVAGKTIRLGFESERAIRPNSASHLSAERLMRRKVSKQVPSGWKVRSTMRLTT